MFDSCDMISDANRTSAVGPYATIYAVWNSGRLSGDGSEADVPYWILYVPLA